jgi:tetratricopeptide (TPR) repeat protein
MFRHELPALLAIVLLVASTGGVAAEPDMSWESGRAAFEAEQYDEALHHFEEARDGGMRGPAVHYNIAVCQYSLGDYRAARDTFRLIASQFPSMRGLAEYNIGLAERRLGNSAAAERQFVAAYRNSDDEKVRALAASQLTEVERELRPDWYGLVGMQLGHDDNVALRDSLGLPAGVTAESPMADLFAVVGGQVAAGLELDASLYAVTYSDASEYNQAEMRVGALYTMDRGAWRNQAGLFLIAGTLGGSSFNREVNLDLRSTRYVGDDTSFELRLRYDEINSAQLRFDGIEGSRSKIDLLYRWHGIGQSLTIGAGIEDNDRLDAGVSPSRQRIQAAYRYRLNDQWGLGSLAYIRWSDYDDVTLPRTEDLFSIAVRVTYETKTAWQLLGTYQYSTNDSSDPIYSYDRNLLTVGFQRPF